MNTRLFFVVSILCLVAGIFVFALKHDWIIIKIGPQSARTSETTAECAAKKNVNLYYFQDGSLKHERVSLLWPEKKAVKMRLLLTHWLAVVDDAGLIPPMTDIEALILSSSGKDVYISFSTNIAGPCSTTFEAWMMIESLLKTIRESDLSVQRVIFFVNHAPMIDNRLDFSRAWPIQGFMGNK